MLSVDFGLQHGMKVAAVFTVQLLLAFFGMKDAVPKPTVNYVVEDSKPGSCKVTLNCSVALENVTYEWLPPERVTSNGGELSVSFNPLVEVYTCVVRNRVSMNRSQLIYKHPCSWEAESAAPTASIKTSLLVSLGCLLLLLLLTPP